MHSSGTNGSTNGRLNTSDFGPRFGSAKLAAMVARRALTLAVLSALLLVGAQPAQGQYAENALSSLASAPFVPTFVSETVVNTGGNEANTSPSITPLPKGRFIVAWHDGGPTTGWGRVYSSNGTPETAQFSLNPNDGSGWRYGHVVAALPNGGIAAFWINGYGYARGQEFDSHFNPVGGEFYNVSPATDWWPAVASSNGNPILNLNEAGASGPVLIVPFDSSLNALPTITADVNPPGVSLSPAIAAAPNGNFTPAWWNTAGDIIMRTFDGSGNPLTGEVTVNSSLGGAADTPARLTTKKMNCGLRGIATSRALTRYT